MRSKGWMWMSGFLCALLSANHLLAQTIPTYRITDLGPIGITPDTDGIGTFGINDRGEVAWYRLDPATGQVHAFIWLPEPAYGLTQGNHDLADVFDGVPGETFDQPSAAFEINVHGQVIGQHGALGVPAGAGIVWELAASNIIEIPFFSEGTGWSRGISINDGTPALLVGESDKLYDCQPCPDNDMEDNVLRAFRAPAVEPITEAVMEELVWNIDCAQHTQSEPHDDTSSNARDINVPPPSGLPHIAGFSDKHGTDPLACTVAGCNGAKDSVEWPNPTTLEVLTDLDDPPALRDSEARGINDNAESVGWGIRADVQQCRPKALYWDEELVLTILGDDEFMPPNDQGDDSRAEAINDATPRHVVGWEQTDNEALLWVQISPTDWDGRNLNEMPHTNAAGCQIILRQAHDIGDNGWIIAWGRFSTEPGFHAFVLSPMGNCPADIDGDDVVGTSDLLALLAAWGDCPPAVLCIADINGDCEVGTADLMILLAEWGPCPESGEPEPRTLEEELADACLTMDDWDDFEASQADPNLTNQQKANWRCWMDHYLDGCSKCSCTHPVCSGSDPFE